MPRFTLAQLVMLEIAAAAAVGGYAAGGMWLPAGAAVAVVVALLAVVPVHRRWAYQLLQSYASLVGRRRSVRGPGLQSLLGGYRVITVSGGRQGVRFGAVRVGATWTVPLELSLDRLLNDDAAVPVDQMAELLRVEDVPLSSVRLVTVAAPAARAAGGPALPVSAPPRLAARYCMLTLDVDRAAVAVAARGGSDDAIAQILRRCTLRAEEIMINNGVAVRRLDEAGVAALFPLLFGSVEQAAATFPPTVETWRDIRVAGTWSVTFAVLGAGADVVDRAGAVASAAPVPTAVTSLLLQPGRGAGAPRATLLLRISGTGVQPDRSAVATLRSQADAAGLTLQQLDGEQGAVLRATAPVGAGWSS